MPRRSPPPPPTTAESARTSPQPVGSGGPIGAFWSTQHGKESAVAEDLSKVTFDEEPSVPERRFSMHKNSPSQKPVQGKSGPSKDFEMNFFQDGTNAFATEFDINKVNARMSNVDSGKEEQLEAEVERLKGQLKQVNMEKSELSSKYEKLSAICRSQRQELHDLKQTLASTTPSPNKTATKIQSSPVIQNQSPTQQVNFSKVLLNLF